MKLLPLDNVYRKWLFQKNALGFDKHLHEHLVGLTHSESLDYLVTSTNPYFSFHDWSVDRIQDFLSMHERYEAALAVRYTFNPFMAQ